MQYVNIYNYSPQNHLKNVQKSAIFCNIILCNKNLFPKQKIFAAKSTKIAFVNFAFEI